MGGRLAGKVAIVTGAGRGIGRAEAIGLAAEGACVVVNDVGLGVLGEGSDQRPAEEVVEAIRGAGGMAIPSFEDITVFANGERIVRRALDTFGRLDIVVNNAGIQLNRPFFEITEEEWDLTIAVHLKGHFTITKHAAQVFRQQRSGRIINTSSLAGLGQLRHVDYCAAKEGIIGLTRSLALELGPYGITVNAVRPRGATRMWRGFNAPPEMLASRATEKIPPFLVYLCTEAAAHINGRDFYVGGDEISLLSMPVLEKTMQREGGWDIESIEHSFPAAVGAGIQSVQPH